MKSTLLILVGYGVAVTVAELSRQGHMALPEWLLFVLVATCPVGAGLYIMFGTTGK